MCCVALEYEGTAAALITGTIFLPAREAIAADLFR